MADLNYSITISAPKQKVWHTMLDLETYKQWTVPFYPGSYYEGSWDKGSDIKFLAEADGKLSGIYGRIVENIPYEYVSVEYMGEIVDGQLDARNDEVQTWIGARESYRFTENDGVTTVDVQLGSEKIGEDMAKMFDGMWPKALQSLKELVENSAKEPLNVKR